MKVQDPVYWLCNPLEDQYIKVLQRIQDGTQGFYQDRFEIAYLIAIECVKAEVETQVLSVTEKGKDAIAFFTTVASQPRPC